MASDGIYGRDLVVRPDANGILDLDPMMIETTGRALLAQSILCRFSTRRGTALGAPDECMALSDFLGEGMTQTQIDQIPQIVKTEVERDERVISADVSCTYTPSTRALSIRMQIQSGDGPFSLTLSLTGGQISISVLGDA